MKAVIEALPNRSGIKLSSNKRAHERLETQAETVLSYIHPVGKYMANVRLFHLYKA